jgi:hypothetical protein
MAQARSAADRRKICPEAFDANGNILPGGLMMVIRKMGRAPDDL